MSLIPSQIDEYFEIHLPYRTGILLAHKRLVLLGPYTGDQNILRACFEASVITGRMYLNMLGIARRDKTNTLIDTPFRTDDVKATDLNGKLLTHSNLPAVDRDLFLGFLRMADKASAHLKFPSAHDYSRTHDAIDRIMHYLDVNLYTPAGRTM